MSEAGRMSFGQPTAADLELMQIALGEARSGLEAGGVPVGAVLASGGEGLALGRNEAVQRGGPPAPGGDACPGHAGRRPPHRGTALGTAAPPRPTAPGRDPPVPVAP